MRSLQEDDSISSFPDSFDEFLGPIRKDLRVLCPTMKHHQRALMYRCPNFFLSINDGERIQNEAFLGRPCRYGITMRIFCVERGSSVVHPSFECCMKDDWKRL